MPYLMGGFPTLAESVRIGEAYVRPGADLIELGVPYSDPLADGPVIHAAGTHALQAGASIAGVLEVARALAAERAGGADVLREHGAGPGGGGVRRAPGEDRGVRADRARSAAGGSARGGEACEAHGLALVPLVAPTTTPERMAAIGQEAQGFLYTVSVVGTTGEREALGERFAEIVARAKASTEVPVALGFGIGTPEQARQAADAGADGVIVGTRLVRAAGEGEDPAGAVGAVVGELAAGLARGR